MPLITVVEVDEKQLQAGGTGKMSTAPKQVKKEVAYVPSQAVLSVKELEGNLKLAQEKNDKNMAFSLLNTIMTRGYKIPFISKFI